MSRQDARNKQSDRQGEPSNGSVEGDHSHPVGDGKVVTSREADPAGGPNRAQSSKAVKIRVREKTAPCPICNESSLLGYCIDLHAEKIEYNNMFLPIPEAGLPIEGLGPSSTLTLLDNYFCPNDLFTYSGHIRVREKDRGRDYVFDNNVFYRMTRFYNVLHDEMVGNRLAFFCQSLAGWGFDPHRLAPVDDGEHDVGLISETWHELLDACEATHPPIRDVYEQFRFLVDSLRWNPLASLTANFHQSAAFMAAFFELQLSDLLFLFRREKIKRSQLVEHQELYRLLESYRRMCLADEPMDDDLAGNVLFHCLKMANLIAGDRHRRLLETAFAVSKFLVRIKSRLGTDLNRKLDVLAGNADVIFYLFLRLTRELKIEDESAEPVFRLLRRRLDLIADYATPQETQESIRIARIGRFLKKFLGEIESEF